MANVKHPGGDTEQFGYTFTGGEPVEVTNEKHLAKFAGNPAFEVDGGPANETADDVLKAVHRGGGRFSIMKGDTDAELAKGLTKADADAFNAMTEDEKAQYVASAA